MAADVTPSPAELADTARRFLPAAWKTPTVSADAPPAEILAAQEQALEAVLKAWGLAEHYLRSQAEEAARRAQRAREAVRSDWKLGGSW